MIEQVIELAQAEHFHRFIVVTSSGTRYPVPTRDHVSIPPEEDGVLPEYFIIYTKRAARFVSVINVASIEVEKSAEIEE